MSGNPLEEQIHYAMQKIVEWTNKTEEATTEVKSGEELKFDHPLARKIQLRADTARLYQGTLDALLRYEAWQRRQ